MKKIFASLLSLVIVLSLVACVRDNGNTVADGNSREPTISADNTDSDTLKPGLYNAEGTKLCSWDKADIDVASGYPSDEEASDAVNSAATIIKTIYKTTTKIVLPETITQIGDRAFSGCDTLGVIILPDSITDIGTSAFTGCTNLTNSSIYYTGTVEQWNRINIGESNEILQNVLIMQIISNNLFDEIFDGVGILSNGISNPNADYVYSTQYYPITNNNGLLYIIRNQQPERMAIEIYDQNKAYLTKFWLTPTSGLNIEKSIPENAAYFRVDTIKDFHGRVSISTTIDPAFTIDTYSAHYIALKDTLPQKQTIFAFVDDDGKTTALQKIENIVDDTGIPYTSAIVTSYVGSKQGNFSNWDEIKRLQEKGIIFVSHTNDHSNVEKLATEDPGLLKANLATSLQLMEQHGITSTNVLVYPGGNIGKTSLPIVQEYFKFGCLVNASEMDANLNDKNRDKYRIRRVSLANQEWDTYKRYVDIALEEEKLCIFYTHLWDDVWDEPAYNSLIDLINYIKSQGGNIMSLPDALEKYYE